MKAAASTARCPTTQRRRDGSAAGAAAAAAPLSSSSSSGGNGVGRAAATTKTTAAAVVVGGEAGHEVEEIDGYPSLIRMFDVFRWKPIRNCPGRYTCRDHEVATNLSPKELVERAFAGGGTTDDGDSIPADGIDEVELEPPGRRDRIVALPLDVRNRVGIISYVKEDEEGEEEEGGSERTSPNSSSPKQSKRRRRYVHTLNTPSGFRRKLEAIGVTVTDDGIGVKLNTGR